VEVRHLAALQGRPRARARDAWPRLQSVLELAAASALRAQVEFGVRLRDGVALRPLARLLGVTRPGFVQCVRRGAESLLGQGREVDVILILACVAPRGLAAACGWRKRSCDRTFQALPCCLELAAQYLVARAAHRASGRCAVCGPASVAVDAVLQPCVSEWDVLSFNDWFPWQQLLARHHAHLSHESSNLYSTLLSRTMCRTHA
jgi:hypothetical protein